MVYLCDAGCRRNPGVHLPVVWDGTRFLEIADSSGTNHRAAYQAVDAALKDAERLRLTHIELWLTSDLVYRQLSTARYCRSEQLAQLRDIVADRASRVAPVRLVLVNAPFKVGRLSVQTRRALRRLALDSRARAELQL